MELIKCDANRRSKGGHDLGIGGRNEQGGVSRVDSSKKFDLADEASNKFKTSLVKSEELNNVAAGAEV